MAIARAYGPRCSSEFEKEDVMADTVRRVEYYYLTVHDTPAYTNPPTASAPSSR